VEITERSKRRLRSGRLTKHAEAWGARTNDGLWEFERSDQRGTPWLAFHLPSVADKTCPLADSPSVVADTTESGSAYSEIRYMPDVRILTVLTCGYLARDE
jgi:hypothetical protein